MLFCCLLIFFFKIKLFLKNSFRNTIRVSNSLDPDQARLLVRPDLDPNSLQRLTEGKALNGFYKLIVPIFEI